MYILLLMAIVMAGLFTILGCAWLYEKGKDS